MKKEYAKPQIEEIKLNIEAPLLVESAEEYDGPTGDTYDTEY
jgi:hypothetical protein